MRDFLSNHKWGIVLSLSVVLMAGYFLHLCDYYDDERRIAEFHNNYPRMNLSTEYMLFEVLDEPWFKIKYAYRYFHWRSSLDAIALLEKKVNKTAEDFIALAERYMLVEKYCETIDAYTTAMNLTGDNRVKAKCLVDRSKIRIINQEEVENAIQDIDNALLLTPDDIKLHELKAYYLEYSGRRVEALKELEYITKHNPTNNEILKKKKDLEETIRNHEKLMQYIRDVKKGR